MAPGCFACGEPATTVDHIIPRSKGGKNSRKNRQPACKACNEAKGDDLIGPLEVLRRRGLLTNQHGSGEDT